MAGGTTASFYRDLDLLAGSATVAGLSDADLLARFALRRDATAEAAFEALVARHGPMVLATCRRALRDRADADDAFQASFLVLARKAGTLRVAGTIGPWLHAVACRVCLKARVVARKRRGREAGSPVEVESTAEDATSIDIRPAVHEELGRLPEKYRAPVVLCHLEGLTHEQAAAALRWPVGTVNGRLSRAREILRDRLSRRGLGVPSTAIVAALSTREASAVPAALISTVICAATGAGVSSSVLHLTRGVSIAMLMNRLKVMSLALSAVAAVTVAAGYASAQFGGPPAKPAQAPAPPPQSQVPTHPAGTAQLPPIPLRRPAGPQIRALRTSEFIAVTSPDGRTLNALSLNDRLANATEWKPYEIPAGIGVIPLASSSVMALDFTGPEIKELAVFHGPDYNGGYTGGAYWSRQPLKTPAKGRVQPIVSQDQVLYQVGFDLYAFSGRTGQWGVLHLEGDEPPVVEFGPESTLVQQGETLYVFKPYPGKWTKGIANKSVATPPPSKGLGP
jgi:RNA polymerase sigma factor (sigma-70 family)